MKKDARLIVNSSSSEQRLKSAHPKAEVVAADLSQPSNASLCLMQICRQHAANKQQASDERINTLSQQLVQQKCLHQALSEEMKRQQAVHQQTNYKQGEPANGAAKQPWYKRRKLLGKTAWGGAVLLPQGHIATRALQVASMLFVLQEQHRSQAQASRAMYAI